MAEFNATAQVLTAGQNVIFDGDGCCSIRHRDGTGLFTLKGSKNCQHPARYKVMLHVVTTATAAAPVQLVLSEDGESIQQSLIAIVPAAIGDVVSGDTVKEIIVDCCTKLAVRAVSAASITSATLVINRIA